MESKQNRTMEKRGKSNGRRREWKEKTKETDWSFGAGCAMGGKLEGQEGGLGGLFGAWAGNVE